MQPFSRVVEDDLWVEANRPGEEGYPTEDLVGDLERDGVPSRHGRLCMPIAKVGRWGEAKMGQEEDNGVFVIVLGLDVFFRLLT